MKKILLTVVLVLIGVMAFTQERIAVFPFEDLNNVFTKEESILFYREFSNEFTNRSAGRFSVIPRQEVEKLINTEAAFQLSDFSAREKTAEMQRVLNGSQILSGLIGRVGNNIRITVSLYTYPELQQLPGGATLSVSNKNELFSKIPELVRSMQNEIAGSEQPLPEGLLYEIVNGKTVTIRGYTGTEQVLNIPDMIQRLPVTEIGYHAFFNHSILVSVTIPSSVTSIGEGAFSNNKYLTSVTIPSSVTSIGDNAFSRTGLMTVTIPSSVTYIATTAFTSNLYLTSFIVDSRNPTYASIDGVLFDRGIRTLIQYPAGKQANTYVLPSSIATIGEHAFYRCMNLISVTIPPSVISIRDHAFSTNGLTSVTIPSSVTSIGKYAFSHNSLTSVTIPPSVTSIGDSAFSVTQLTSVTIPPSVTYIGNNAFYGTELISISVDNRNPAYTSFDGVLFDKNMQTLIEYPRGRQASTYIIPSSVTSIRDLAFWCARLTSVTIPSSVTYIGKETFTGNYYLTNITIPSSVTVIGDFAFANCDSLTSVTLSRRTQVADNAFPPSARITYRD
jgi:TolB-like protein